MNDEYPKLEHYEILDKIKSGGFAQIYLAHDKISGFPVAIKELYHKLSGDKFIKEKFIDEANYYLYLNHENIVHLNNFIAAENNCYLVMEYIDGWDIDEYIRSISGPMQEDLLTELFVQILDAFAFAHHQGIYHLDIKPSNIRITKGKKIKILDFGIAATHGSYNKANKNLLTTRYASPEQVRHENYDWRSDIYSLGVTMHQMVTAKPPYMHDFDDAKLRDMVCNHPLPRAKSLYPFVSQKIQDIIDRATEKDPDKRFQSCEEFKAVLLGFA